VSAAASGTGRGPTSTIASMRTRSMRCAPCSAKRVTVLPKLSAPSRRSSGGGSIASACETTRCQGSTRGVRRASCQLCDTGAS
jgi:hypothetical protein